MRVDVSSWHFEYLHDTPIDKALAAHDPSFAKSPEIFDFSDANALLEHLDGPGDSDRVRFQGSIDKRMDQDPGVKAILGARTPLGQLKHFPIYRGPDYDKYHLAARRIAVGSGTQKDFEIVEGLDAEIAASRILLEPGQLLFHGRCNDLLTTEHPYPTYVSSSLDPIVALNSAYRRGGIGQANGKPIVFVLELAVALPALWGHVGGSAEWELLLPRCIDWAETARRTGNAFDVVHARAVASP